jgi:cytochrome c oxidase subunit 2
MRGCLILALALLGVGCTAGPQSALDPHGYDASRVSVLAWTLFVGAAVILAIVLAATAVALRGPERWRRLLASDGAIRLAGLAWPAVTLAALLAWSLWLTHETGGGDRPAALRIEATGERWWWRVRYPAADGAVTEANEVRLPVGVEVDLVLHSADVIHSFWVPSLGGKLDMVPGRTNVLRVRAERAGIYRGQCAEYCGGPHAQMAFFAVAMAPEDFARWLKEPAPEPAGDAARRGSILFLAAGCGACHAVRGTEARGQVGPDLTRVGSRRDIAAGALPNNPENLKRFIVDGQRVKPGNRMPEFRIFSAGELDDLTAYLTGLR